MSATFTADEIKSAADLGERMVANLMARSALLRAQADACWDIDPDTADKMDKEEVRLRLEAAVTERAVAELRALLKSRSDRYEVIEVTPDPTDICPLSPR